MVTASVRRAWVILLLCLLPLPLPVVAQGVASPGACGAPDAGEIDHRCAEGWLREAERRMDATYERLLARLRRTEAVKLRESQRAWLRFRDADVELVVHHYGAGEAPGRAVAAMHALKLTRDRLWLLESRLATLEDS